MARPVLLIALVASFIGTGANPADAQIQASERAMVSQTIDGTTLTLDYARPQVRGRDLFGGIVPWNVVWTPGANWATTLEVDNDVTLNGVAVPAGKYSVWAIPREDEWLMMLNPDPKIFHFMKPDSSQATVHIPSTPEQGEHAEMLTWAFSQVRGDFGTLEFRWGDTAVPLHVQVQPTRPAITTEEIAMYVGTYDMTVVPAYPSWPADATLEVFEENGRLRGRMSFTIHPVDDEVFDVVPMGGSRFNPGLYRAGEFFNVEMGVGFDFTLGSDRADGFQFIAGNGMVLGEGIRTGGQ
jgi:Protein of unknown function (DUF2911)